MAEQTKTPAPDAETASRVVGVLAEFPNPGQLMEAARSLRLKGYKRYDTYSPFPIHGMDKAMGLGQSMLGFIVFGGGISGAALGYLLQWWTGAIQYPLNISGKPFFAFWSSVPIMFELTILCAAIGAVVGMFALNRLPQPYNPLFNSERFAGVTDDRFFLQVEADDPKFDLEETGALLKQLGALATEPVRDEE